MMCGTWAKMNHYLRYYACHPETIYRGAHWAERQWFVKGRDRLSERDNMRSGYTDAFNKGPSVQVGRQRNI